MNSNKISWILTELRSEKFEWFDPSPIEPFNSDDHPEKSKEDHAGKEGLRHLLKRLRKMVARWKERGGTIEQMYRAPDLSQNRGLVHDVPVSVHRITQDRLMHVAVCIMAAVCMMVTWVANRDLSWS